MPKPLDDIDVVVLSIATPIQVGAYKDKILIDSLSKDGLSSDVLPLLFDILLKKYNIHTIYYINGPGSYMAIKVCYIFLISLCMIKGFKLLSCSGFEFNNNSAIKAINDRYFFNQKDKIVLKKIQNTHNIDDFKLPKSIKNINYSLNAKPNFVLPVI